MNHLHRFAALDVEVANNDRRSICQVGLVRFEHGRVLDRFCTLVDPRAPFGEYQVQVHGITADKVAGAPTFAMLAGRLRDMLDGWMVASHSNFDQQAINAAYEHAELQAPNAQWLNTMNVLPRAWPEEFDGKKPRNLKRVAEFFKVQFEHHDAAEDAQMCALIVLRACAHTGLAPQEWLKRCQQPVLVSA